MANYQRVILTAPGDRKVGVMKKLGELLGSSLGEAKKALEQLPLQVADLPLTQARALVEELESLGAEARYEPSGRFDEVEGATYIVHLVRPGDDVEAVTQVVAAIRRVDVDDELIEAVVERPMQVVSGVSADEVRAHVESLQDAGAVVGVIVQP